MNWDIPFFDLRLGEEEKQAVVSVIEDNWLTMGPKIAEFEADFADIMDTPDIHAIAVTNCTAALHLAVAALGIGPEDEVICPSLTFVATANAVRYTGATPVFADICSDSDWTIDPEDIARKITPKTKAIMVMHYGGYPCQMDAIRKIAEEHGLFVIEDACHGLLAKWQGQMLGTIGKFGCFSFYTNKNMSTGEGGMIVTRDQELADKVRLMRSHSMTASSYERFKGHAFGYDVTNLGYNYRMDELRAAIGIVQLRKLPETTRMRGQLIAHYKNKFSEMLPGLTVPFIDRSGQNGYHIFPVLLPSTGPDRSTVMEYLSSNGIQTSIHYRPVHSLTAYANMSPALPVTETVAPCILSLPLYPHLKPAQIDKVVSTLKECLAP